MKHAKRKAQLIVVTGGPGAGKTAILETAKKTFCEHVAILPEAATILFNGGFPRKTTRPAREAVQRAIFHVQRQLERLLIEEGVAQIILCDRGTLDGLAYWPGTERHFFDELNIDRESEFGRYKMVVHLRTPSVIRGYDYTNPVRIETPAEAAAIDERIGRVWMGHPNFHVIPDAVLFADKTNHALELIREQIPNCEHARLR